MTRKERQPSTGKDGLWRGGWPAADLKQLKKLWPGNSTAFVASALRRPADAVRKMASRLGLKKSKTYMRSLGRK